MTCNRLAPAAGVGTFDDRLLHPLPGVRDRLRLMRGHAASRPFRPLGGENVPVLADPPELEQDGVQWLGHASALAVVDGLRIAFDPVFATRLGPVRRAQPAPVAPDALRPDIVCISHDHRDHLDAQAAKALRDALWLVPAGTEPWCRRHGIRRVQEFDWGDRHEVEEVRFTFVPAHHWCRRTLGDTNQRLWGGWTVQGSWSIYHAGDTGMGPAVEGVAKTLPDLDLAMLPIGGCEPRWFMQHKHLNPEDAALAMTAWDHAVLVPIHWGTYRISVERLDTLMPRLQGAWRDQGLPAERLEALPIGGAWRPTQR